MHETKEIRWFFQSAIGHIENWFDGLAAKTVENRTDLYLTQKNQNIGIKLRDGKLDIKQRIGTRSKDCLGPDIWGHYDRFIKWTFDVDSGDSPIDEILDDRFDRWLPVEKERMLVQLTREENTTVIRSVDDDVPFGCQVEYSRVCIQQQVWYTFALECFGDQCLKSDSGLVSEIFGDTKLNMQQSLGYADFLDRYQNVGRTALRPLRDLAQTYWNS